MNERVEVRIRTLVVDGVELGDEAGFGAAVQSALEAMVRDRGFPGSGFEAEAAASAPVALPSNGAVDGALAEGVASAIWSRLR